jgi:2-polyprenyl-3-methyl-5-hydroxy-6-metoxy-1,4-benzoquinol methylase
MERSDEKICPSHRIVLFLNLLMDDRPLIELTCCPICGSNAIERTLDVVDHFSSGELFPLMDCRRCGFRFTNPFPSEKTIGRYYDSPEYIAHSDTHRGLVNKLYHAARQVMVKRKVRLVTKATRGVVGGIGKQNGPTLTDDRANVTNESLRLLDMGCGTGYFLHAAKRRGFAVSGIEKEQKAREYAVDKFGLEAWDEKRFWNIEPASYHVVTLWHVLEHLEKLNESVVQIKEMLTDEGAAVIAVPNHLAYDARFYKERWAAYDVPRHLWHFTPATLERLLVRHGLVVTGKHALPFDPFYISLLSEKYVKSTPLVRWVRAPLVGLVSLARSWYDIEQASSIVVIARKSSKS